MPDHDAKYGFADLSFLDLGNAKLSELAIISLPQKPNLAYVAALSHIESYSHRPTIHRKKKLYFFGTCHLGGFEQKWAELDQPSGRSRPS